jgi:hypothetical protein
MYIKLPLYGTLFFYMALGLNDCDGANPLRGPLEAVVPDSQKFFGPTTSNGSLNWICSHQDNYVPRHIDNSYINS